MAKKRKITKKIKSKNDDSKLFAFLAVFLSVVGFIIALIAKRDDKYVMFYAKQSLILFIAVIIVGVINMILGFVPILGWLIITILSLALVFIWIVALTNSLSGKQKQTPLIGQYAKNIDL